MAKIWLDHSDGRYSTRLLTDEEAADHEARGFDVAYVEDAVWAEYSKHCGNDGIWQALWQSISNEMYTRRREAELLPLENAALEIRRLTDRLAQAERVRDYYEGENALMRKTRHREEYRQYSCIFPQPGCEVTLLSWVAWQETAQEILDYPYGAQAQGLSCCCGNEHKRLDEATANRLREAGFLVEGPVLGS